MNEALAKAKSPLKFEIVFGDSKSNPPFAQGEALRLINEQGAKALVADSSGVTVAINRLNYDPASKAKGKVAITCFQCSSSFINDPAVTENDPQVQAAERDADNWLYRVFYVAKYEAAALVQIALKKVGKKDGPVKIAIFADGGHRALATDIVKTLPAFNKQATVKVVYMTALDKIAADWGKVIDDKDESRQGRPRSGRGHRRDAAGSVGGGDQGLPGGGLQDRDPVEQLVPPELQSSKASARRRTGSKEAR